MVGLVVAIASLSGSKALTLDRGAMPRRGEKQHLAPRHHLNEEATMEPRSHVLTILTPVVASVSRRIVETARSAKPHCNRSSLVSMPTRRRAWTHMEQVAPSLNPTAAPPLRFGAELRDEASRTGTTGRLETGANAVL